ncbi:MAG: gliding motility-associated C-terminal domain-containing protein, partial [Bacteroidales bacterium]|nr:gliding motility-associated C-terminal domain-containing protein [Bacteroidales bacterium]
SFVPNVPLFSQSLEIPVLINVTVDKTTQQALLNWTFSNPAIINGYIIKRQINGQGPAVVEGSYQTIETINNPNQFSYLDGSIAFGPSLPASGVETYRVVAFDATDLSNMSNPVSTIYLSTVEFDLCQEQNRLIWTSYNGFGSNLSGYNVYYSNTLAGTPILIAELGAVDTTFTHTNVAANEQYYYYVEALNSQNTLVSVSNIQQISTTMPPVPQIMNADYASVEGYEQVDLSFTLDQNGVVNEYLLLKSDSLVGTYDTLSRFPSGIDKLTYSDFVKTNQVVAFYKVLAINTCGLPGRESNVAHNIVLEATTDNTNIYQNNLTWNPYEGWRGGVATYTIFRSVDGGAFEEIVQLNAGDLSYVDDVSQWVQPEYNGQASKGHFCYYIEAREGSANPYGIEGVSKSNISCAHQETVTYLPNAFNPMSQTEANRTFKPVISFVNDYQLIIYNRWGEIVFKSSDPLLGWDGKGNDGNLLKKGTYVFYLKYRSANNKLIEKSGQINLVY